ncbi:MAG TPA: hypothetical protein ENK18_28605 [Deltaproteobacteria bacterium]|nr:hypothetical protein [Deltaproteobacteria bacterium]
MGHLFRSCSLATAILAPRLGHTAPQLDDGYGSDPREPLRFAFEDITPAPEHDRSIQMEVNLRLRAVSVPRGLLDVWFFDVDDGNWAYIEPRPTIQGHVVGLEYVLRGDSADGIFYLEYLDSAMPGGYWDDIEVPVDHLDGAYLVPSKGLGVFGVGADYAYETYIVPLDATNEVFGMSFLIGGGLGLGILTGRLDRWGPDAQGNPSYKRYLDGLPPDEDRSIPRMYPLVDVNAGLRFSFGDRASLRLEGGLHTLLYYGASFGTSF